MNILVVGGAGYIGSHTVRALEAVGHNVWVYDNLVTGHRDAVRSEQLIEGCLTDRANLEIALNDHQIEAVMHFAAFALVGESVTDPAKYYQNNIVATLSLLDAMRACGVQQLVFSSTTATYGDPEKMPISEDTPQRPINPYGFTKFVVERAMSDYAQAYGLGFASLRYFNAAGASPSEGIGEDHEPESHLIPLVLQVALGQREHIVIFGDNFPTRDGTCVRDYVHVDDLAQAHLLALDRIEAGHGFFVNLGNGLGCSVNQVIEACRRVTGHPIPAVVGNPRVGDPPTLIADASRAKTLLGWEPKYPDIESIIQTAWGWHSTHPNGYRSGCQANNS